STSARLSAESCVTHLTPTCVYVSGPTFSHLCWRGPFGPWHSLRRATWHRIALFFFFSSRRRHTRSKRDWSSDVCSSDLGLAPLVDILIASFPRLKVEGNSTLPKSAFDATLIKEFEGAARIIVRFITGSFVAIIIKNRSEERRVGKEGRTRGETMDSRKKD